MKRWIYICLMALFLTGCASYQMPPFGKSNDWTLTGNIVSSPSKAMSVDIGGGSTFQIINSSNGEYDLNFITSQADFDRYDPSCAQYFKDMLKAIPLKVDSIELILADRYAVLATSVHNFWKPDYVRKTNGSQWVTQANPVTSDIQPHDELWRNYIFDKGKRRITVVDRIVKNGKHLAIVYILQSEKKGIPYHNAFHYDILDQHNIQAVGEHMVSLLDISIKAMESKAIGK